jgi:hypothetical protein
MGTLEGSAYIEPVRVVLAHREVALGRHDHVVEEPDAEELAGVDQALGDLSVFGSPLGWSCAISTAHAPTPIAAWKISRGCTSTSRTWTVPSSLVVACC